MVTADRKRRWETLLETSSLGDHLLIVQHAEDDRSRPPLHPDRTRDRIEWAWAKYERQLSRINWLADDRVPYLDCITGTEIFAAAFGCEVEYPDDNMPFAKPLVSSAGEAARLTVPSLDAPTLAQAFEIGDELVRRAGSDAILRLPDIQSPTDIAGIIWDKNDFFISMVESPDAVRALAEKARSLLVAFLDEWFARYGQSFVAHYPDYYMPYGVTLSEDEIGSVSPDVFESMFLDELQALSDRYGAIGIHCCAHAEHQWRGLTHVRNLRVLNLNQSEEVLARAYPYFGSSVCQLPVPAPFSLGAADASDRGERTPHSVRVSRAWQAALEAVGEARVIWSVPAASDDEARAIADGFRDALPE